MKNLILILLTLLISGCATITSDANIPIALSFSDGSKGECKLQNERGFWQTNMPDTVLVRRDDEGLRYDCKTETGASASGLIPSSIDGAKFMASIIFIDLGITDAITDKHRSYPATFTIPIK